MGINADGVIINDEFLIFNGNAAGVIINDEF
jgi:hypothetical protein